MRQDELTASDWEFIMDAIDAKMSDMDSGDMIGMMLGSILCPNDPEKRAQFEAEQEKKMHDAKAKRKSAKERAILLKAKLIQIRDSKDAETLSEVIGVTR